MSNEQFTADHWSNLAIYSSLKCKIESGIFHAWKKILVWASKAILALRLTETNPRARKQR
jgi:hypothetical protein